MRIGIVCPYDLGVPGGVQQVARELARRLRESGDAAVLVGPGDATGNGFSSVGRSVTVAANRSRVPLSLDPRSIAATRRKLAEVDVVHVHEPFLPLVGWAGLMGAKPTVATFHADPARWSRRLYRWLALAGDAWLGGAEVTAVSSVAAEALPRRWGPIEIIPNAIDTAAYHVEVARSPRRVAFLGRDDPRKGLDVILAAWPGIHRTRPDSELIVIGGSRPDAPPGVRYLGRLDEEEKRRALASAAVYAAPNLGGESFGLVLAEGMAAGCAVVASDLPAFRSVLGEAGRLVPPGDVTALATAIGALLDDPRESSRLGGVARTAAGRYDWSQVVGAYQRVYESALEPHRSSMDREKE
ncbi:MAG: glycosyltransferase family 4 protein [Acidimicrobiia bacterium]